MTRTVPSNLQTHLDSTTTSTATLWQITRQDTAVLRFTDHDRDITFAGNVYKSAVGYQRTDIAANATLAVDSLDVQGILNAAEIAEADLRAGRYDYAEVRISLINWADPDGDGEVSLRKGWFGEIIFDENSGAFTTELRGLSQAFAQNIIEQYGRPCRYNFGDARCDRDKKFNIAAPLIADSTAYALGDVVRVPAVGASSPPITVDFGDTVYRVSTAGTTGAGLVDNFPTVLSSANTPATTLSVDDSNTFSRASGSFVTDGWEIDMVFRSSGFTNGANNGVFRVTAVTALTIDVTPASLVVEAGTGDEVLTHIAYNNGVEFTPENAFHVAGEVLSVVDQSTIVVGPPAAGGLMTASIFMENSGFETGDLTDWTVTDVGNNPGNIVVTTVPRSGSYCCELSRGWLSPAGDTEMEQIKDVSDYASAIDAGGHTVTVSWYHRGTGGGLAGRSQILYDFLDQNDTLISTHTGGRYWNGGGSWLARSEQGTIPALTRKIKVRLFGGELSGDHFVDDFDITTSLVDPNFPDDEFNYGVMTFDSGLNAGLSMDVKDYVDATKTFTLYLSMPYPIAVGDKVGVHVGCNSELSRCTALANVLNHGGFPYIPGDDEFLGYPDSPY